MGTKEEYTFFVADSWACMSRAPRLSVPLKGVPLRVLDRGAFIALLLLRRLQAWKVLAGRLHLDLAIRPAAAARVLLDALDEAVYIDRPSRQQLAGFGRPDDDRPTGRRLSAPVS